MPDNRLPEERQDDDKALYEELLPAALRKAYRAAGSDLDLCPEMRLMRAFLTLLFRQPARNQIAINQATSALARMIYIQHHSAGRVSDLETALIAGANAALDQ